MTGDPAAYDIVIPTIGRPSLELLRRSLSGCDARPASITVVDDSRSRLGPAAARNHGAAFGSAPWIVFLDDDVLTTPMWQDALLDDLRRAADDVAAIQARISVPLPTDRAPTDWERNVAKLGDARWITADLAVRRDAFEAVGGFDEIFERAYREDSDLALRLESAGWRLTVGERWTTHPVRPATFLTSVTTQRGNADDALMTFKHGRQFRARLGEPASMLWKHWLTTIVGALAIVAGLTRHRRAAVAAIASWMALTTQFTWKRTHRGPGGADEIARMVVTSILIPPVAVYWSVKGRLRAGRLGRSMGTVDGRPRMGPPRLTRHKQMPDVSTWLLEPRGAGVGPRR